MTMTNQSQIEKIIGEKALSISPIDTGLTNDNFHVTTKTRDLVLRLPKIENAHLFDYPHEHLVLNLIKNLSLEPELISYDPKTGIKCATYIEDAHTLTAVHYLDAVGLIARLHNANLTSGKDFHLEEQFELYKPAHPIHNLDPYKDFITQAEALKSHIRLCHNDCVEGNFLFTKDNSYLIDFEYALDNDPYFDLMSLITENDITDKKARKEIIEHYFSLVDIPFDPIKLKVFEGALLVLWCAWACSMYEIHKEKIYKDIADLKYLRLLQLD